MGGIESGENPGKDSWNPSEEKKGVSWMPWCLLWFHVLSQITFYHGLWSTGTQVFRLLEHPGHLLGAVSAPGWTLQLHKVLIASLLLPQEGQRQSRLSHALPSTFFKPSLLEPFQKVWGNVCSTEESTPGFQNVACWPGCWMSSMAFCCGAVFKSWVEVTPSVFH